MISLASESIENIRKDVATARKPVMTYSIGKDISVMLRLVTKAFYPAPPPFPLLHIDTGWKFKEMYAPVTQQRVVFPVLRAPLTSLRWDISNRPAYCKVQKMWDEDENGQVQRACQFGTDLFGPTSSDTHHLSSAASGDCVVLSSGVDHHVPLNVPASVLQAIPSCCSFCTEMQIILPMLALRQIGQVCAV